MHLILKCQRHEIKSHRLNIHNCNPGTGKRRSCSMNRITDSETSWQLERDVEPDNATFGSQVGELSEKLLACRLMDALSKNVPV